MHFFAVHLIENNSVFFRSQSLYFPIHHSYLVFLFTYFRVLIRNKTRAMQSHLLHSASRPQYGSRLIPQIIDEIAREDPGRIFAAYPRSKNLADGFVNVSYHSLANAINRACWWLFDAMGHADTPETFAYFGPSDLRFPIFVVAAIKCGYKVRLKHKVHLLRHLRLTQT